MNEVLYYQRPSGRQPLLQWLDSSSLSKKERAQVKAKIADLQQHGMELLANETLKRIEPCRDLYELVAGRFRICVFLERLPGGGRFILLRGFPKKKQRPRTEYDACKKLAREHVAKGGT